MDTGQVGRRCRKCVPPEVDEEKYLADLRDYIANLDVDVRAEPAVYGERLSVCEACELLRGGLCAACGCFVELRAAVRGNSCPYDKWGKSG